MCELDVFVGNFAIIDWELYHLWLSGRSVAEAVPVFVRDNRQVINDFHASQDIIVSDFNDNWRLFSTLENALLSSSSGKNIIKFSIFFVKMLYRLNFLTSQVTKHPSSFWIQRPRNE